MRLPVPKSAIRAHTPRRWLALSLWAAWCCVAWCGAPQRADAAVVALQPLVGARHGEWRVTRVEAKSVGVVELWLVGADGAGQAVQLVCRPVGAPQLPAVAHSARFDLRTTGRRATPEPLALAVIGLADTLRGLEAGLDCQELAPAGQPPTPHASAATAVDAMRPAPDLRLTVRLERILGQPVRDVSLGWLSLWLGALLLWAGRGAAQPHPSPEGPRTPTATRQHLAALVGIVLAGLALRLVSVAVFTLNPDEHASLDAASWLQVFRGDDDSLYHPPLARAVFRGWTGLWPGAYAAPRWWWRLPSVLAGTASIGLVWQLARTRAGPVAGLVAAALLAGLPHAVFLSDLAKPYAMTTCAVLAAIVVADRLLRGPLEPGGGDASRATRRASRWPIAALALLGATTAWLDYPAALALALAGVAASVATRTRRDARALPQALAWGGLGAAPLLPLALSGVQFAAARARLGAAISGFPDAPHLPPSLGLGGGHFDELLRLMVVDLGPPFVLSPLVAIALTVALLIGLAVVLRGAWRACPSAVWLGAGWLLFAVLLAQKVYLRPQNLGFVLAWTQVVLAIGVARLLPARQGTMGVIVVILLLARGPQMSTLFANQVEGSKSDMAFGPDCHRVAQQLLPWRYLGVDTLVQVDGDPHCVLVELVRGDPHQRAFPLATHRPLGAPCYDAAGLRLCAAGGSVADFSRELASLEGGVAVVQRRQGPARPPRCADIGRTADFLLWWCGAKP